MKHYHIIVSATIVIIIFFVAGMLFQKVFAIELNNNIKNDVMITAHRGGAGYGIENTLQAISRSLKAGVKSIEIDVHSSKDGKIIVCHDKTVNRTTNGKGVIKDLDSSILLDLSIIDKHGNITTEKLPELWQVLELINGKAELLLEIKHSKNDNTDIEYLVVNTLQQYNAYSWTVIQSFNDIALETIHSIDPSIRLEKLLFCKLGKLPIIYDGSFTYFSLDKYKYVESFNFYYKGLSRSLSDFLHQNGKLVRIWTVNNPKRLPNYEYDGIITDYPDIFIEYYKNNENNDSLFSPQIESKK